jgi:glycosyltransferase involved in cell wall biosynthesis
LKLLHIIPTYKPAFIYGGPIFSVSLLCENLAKAGHEVLMLTTTANGPNELDVPTGTVQNVDGVPTIYYRRYTKDHTHLAPALIWHVFKKCKNYDAVHIHSWWNIPVILCVLCCWLRGVKPVLSPRGMLSGFTFEKNNSSAKGLFHRSLGKFLLQKTRLHLTSEAERQEAAHIGTDSFVLPNFIQTVVTGDGSRPPALKSGSPFTIIFLSRIHPKKNLEGLMGALGMAQFDFTLKIAGMGEAEYIAKLKTLATEKGISEKVEWVGELFDEDKFDFYKNADLFVLPSFNENFANVVIEVLSTGTPVMVSDEVGLAAYVVDNGLGWTCSTEPSAIAGQLGEIVQQKEKLAAIRQQAPAIIKRDFSPQNLTGQYVGEYQKLLQRA